MSAPDRKALLADLYSEIHREVAPLDHGTTPLAPRRVEPRALDSDLILLAQGLAQGTQRVTGYPYRRPDGLSPAGRRLDGYLESLGYTIDHTDLSRTYVYSTDLVPWYPGKHPSGKGDLKPTAAEVDRCWRWFERECALVEPSAIVLMGRWAAARYLRRYADGHRVGRLEDEAAKPVASTVGGKEVLAVPAYHPSAVWGTFEVVGNATWRQIAEVLGPVLDRRPGPRR